MPHLLNEWIDLVVLSGLSLLQIPWRCPMSTAPSHLVQSSEPGAVSVMAGIFLDTCQSMHQAARVCGSEMRRARGEGQDQYRMSRVQNQLSFLTLHFQVHSDSRMKGESYLTLDLPAKSWALMGSRWKSLHSMLCLSRRGSLLEPLDSSPSPLLKGLLFGNYSMGPQRIFNEGWADCSFP